MRRLIGIAISVLVAAGAALAIATVAQGGDSYKFDVIFDNGRALIAGETVKIAGAVAGTVSNVSVTPDEKAKVEGTITNRFQFHTDASCLLRPEGLIAEDYLECDPGSPNKPLLASKNGQPPTVPVSQTKEPVQLQDLFDIFNVPTSERFQALINELGISTAGTGDQLNSILRRANPTLQLADNVIGILNSQTSQLSTAINATDQIARTGVNRTAAVHNFVTQANGLLRLTNSHTGSMEQSINKLPGLLASARPALNDLNTVAVDGTPLLSSIRQATPALNKVSNDIVPFTKLAEPNLASLAGTIDQAIPDATAARPLVHTVTHYLNVSATPTAQFASMMQNMLQHGVSENFLSILYYISGALSKYDSHGHMLSGLLENPNNGDCVTYSRQPENGCQAHFQPQPGFSALPMSRTRAGIKVGNAVRKANKRSTTTKRAAKQGGAAPGSAPDKSSAAAASALAAGTPTGSSSPNNASSGAQSNPLSNLGGGMKNLGSTLSGTVDSVTSGTGTTTAPAPTATSAAQNNVGTTLNSVNAKVNQVLGSQTGTGTGTTTTQTSTTGTQTSTTASGGSLQSLLSYLLK
ncbi:MAG: hypothetical protein J2O48_00720 [Solirubrobacterales bacterium]|nr:hypothetical protein [Solirubrobacterales bacterium]